METVIEPRGVRTDLRGPRQREDAKALGRAIRIDGPPWGDVDRLNEALAYQQVERLDHVRALETDDGPVRFVDSPRDLDGLELRHDSMPDLVADCADILEAIGYSTAEIEGLAEGGVISLRTVLRWVHCSARRPLGARRAHETNQALPYRSGRIRTRADSLRSPAVLESSETTSPAPATRFARHESSSEVGRGGFEPRTRRSPSLRSSAATRLVQLCPRHRFAPRVRSVQKSVGRGG